MLQIAGFWLWQARSQDHDEKWAKAKFDQEAKHIQRDRNPVKIVVRNVSQVGGLAHGIGGTIGDLGNFMVGASLLIAIVLVVTGVVIQNSVRGTQQDTNSNFK